MLTLVALYALVGVLVNAIVTVADVRMVNVNLDPVGLVVDVSLATVKEVLLWPVAIYNQFVK